MDFYKIKERTTKRDTVEVYPVFTVGRSKDIMIRGKSFYAVWDQENNIWSTDEYIVPILIDRDLAKHKEAIEEKLDCSTKVKWVSDFSSNSWLDFKRYVASVSDNVIELDNKIVFQNQEVTRKDYCSKKLSYPLVKGECPSYEKIMSTLYSPEEREKIEWAIGAVIRGDAKKIQKFLVFYGEGGTGKSTVLNIIQQLFQGYCATFDAKALTSNNDSFGMEPFKTNPLVAIQHDGDLSRIEDNTKLNSIISHEDMTVNEKFKPKYTMKVNCMLFMGTNKPVKITDAKSGIIRRLIDVSPTGTKLPPEEYYTLTDNIEYELGAIAYHCLSVYKERGKSYYSTYKPIEMMLKTDIFFNFIEEYCDEFKKENGVSLKRAYDLYKQYCGEVSLDHVMPRHRFRDEIKNYFREFHERIRIGDIQYRSYYTDFIDTKVDIPNDNKVTPSDISLVLDSDSDILDTILRDCKAQYTTTKETPLKKWAEVTTSLKDLETDKLHYVKPPENHIVIDFDLKDDKGNKSLELNLAAASKWPQTYAEASKSGNGIHLHYEYAGDVSRLSRVHSEGIEIKVFTGDSSLRRKRIKNNNLPVTTISSGLPLKGEKMVNFDIVKNERALRRLIKKNLRKEVHPGTKPSIDFIHKILEDAHASGVVYDLTDMRPAVLAFANNSTNQSDYCVKLVSVMQFKSENENEDDSIYDDDTIVFYDVEVFPNLFIVCWKKQGEGNQIVRMINPCPGKIEKLMNMKLVGFNNRRYDNHILYGRYMGYNNKQLYDLSQRIINNSPNAMFAEAYNMSYTDIYCFSSKKQSLKKFEIELGLHHDELGLPWDQEVPEDMWERVAEYCDNDVIATEAVFEARYEDFMARQILAELSGLTVNDTTQKHTARILFGTDKNPQSKFVYTDLSEMFPGYKYSFGKSTYRGESVGEGGYVYAEPGIYTNAALIDVKSMHPNSLIQLNHFGPYTERFEELVKARVAIKEKRYDDARNLMGGILKPFLEDPSKISTLPFSLKIVINIVYGMTSAKFDNPFRDPRNVDNIVAKRGALFMMDLKYAIQEKGYTVLHVKTDSVKVANADDYIIQFVHDFGKQYGYEFDHEATYEKIALVNDAVYIAKDSSDGHWSATGTQFAVPYVYKTLFSKEKIEFKDLVETKSVTSALYLDVNEGMEDVSAYESVVNLRDANKKMTNKEIRILEDYQDITTEELEEVIAKGHNYKFIGKVGAFVPIKPGCGGGILYRIKDGKYYAATGTKGYRWLEAEYVQKLGLENDIDYSYYEGLANKAIDNISQYGDFEWFRE